MRLLIIEDEVELANSLKTRLNTIGYAVDIAYDGLVGEEKALVNNYDIVVLDLNLPNKNGIEVCKALRTEGVESAIIMLTARDTVKDKTLGLDNGADDYLIKPFAFEELRARIQALVRRSYQRSNPIIKLDELVINPLSRMVTFNNIKLSLTTREFDILEYIAVKYPTVVSTEDILEHVWDENIDSFSNVVRVHLANLRRKLKNNVGDIKIETIKGKGYRLCLNSKQE
ncbi:response regulator transcription factor [Clostridium sp. 'deep sea']|uniref:response regulator transcription factor n=1 Tax=Clostridium sp. 'deep sea' TaxID=2779445 RepID=UPI0018969959|nr:response regulator transcription factor [Clostridium sp. 'deep sea']QOR35250.1 response regulator transcription factor [Clostridium sp. 'deep sea']